MPSPADAGFARVGHCGHGSKHDCRQIIMTAKAAGFAGGAAAAGIEPAQRFYRIGRGNASSQTPLDEEEPSRLT
jgi:hypothetical protein